jgi:hypothetical protein
LLTRRLGWVVAPPYCRWGSRCRNAPVGYGKVTVGVRCLGPVSRSTLQAASLSRGGVSINPEEPRIDAFDHGISRRRMLKRIGAGAAIAWSVPVLSSVRTPAFAQSPGFPCHTCDPNQPCGPRDPCGPSGLCACLALVNGPCQCGDFPSDFCADYPPCDSDADCPAGQRCYETCCPTDICRGPCTGSSRKPKMRGSGLTVTR